MNDSINQACEVEYIVRTIEHAGGKCFYVGGCVRDSLLGVDHDDFDIEVFSLTTDELSDILNNIEGINTEIVGKSFGVFRCQGHYGMYDISLPRNERVVGVGHKDFEISVNPFMSTEEASLRRDFTINSVMSDSDGNKIDHYGGQEDIKNRVLRHVSDRFDEDPLRVLRGAQFISRFNLTPTKELIDKCYALRTKFDTIPTERVVAEFNKLLLGKNPRQGLLFLRDTGWLQNFPLLHRMNFTPQNPEYHPEGNVFEHTCHVVQAMADLAVYMDEGKHLELMYAALCHDLGKPDTTFLKNGAWVSPKHDKVGEGLTVDFLSSLQFNPKGQFVTRIKRLVRYHMFHLSYTRKTDLNKVARKIAHKVSPSNLVDLSFLITADMRGRPPLNGDVPEIITEIMGYAHANDCVRNPIPNIATGKLLLSLGVPHGREIGKMQERIYNLQIRGTVRNEEDVKDMIEMWRKQ